MKTGTLGEKRFRQAGERTTIFGVHVQQAKGIGKLILMIWLMSKISLASAITPGDYIWTGGTCCGQNQPQFIHNPQALVNYFVSTPLPAGSPNARTFPSYTTCLAPPTALGQSCYVYAWSTILPYTSEAACPVTDLTTDPADPNGLNALSKQFNETPEQALLTQNLEGGMNGYSLLSDNTQKGEQCLANLIGSELSQADSGYKVTSTVRTLAYQAHLLAVWKKFFELQKTIKKKPAIKQMCPALIAKIEGEMGFSIDQDPTDTDLACSAPGRDHCIRSKPAATDPKHTKNLAFDISSGAVKAFQNKYVIDSKRNMATAANACNLTWGGTFSDYDPVHFLCCVK